MKLRFNTKLQPYDKIISYMNTVYEVHTNPLTQNVEKDIIKLNNIVIDKMTNVMINEIKQHLGYIRDASQLPEPIGLPQHITTKNSIQFNHFNYELAHLLHSYTYN